MYNTITPERFAVISFVFVVVLIAGVVCAGLSQENKHLKKQVEQKVIVTKKDFRLRIGGVVYLIEIDNTLNGVVGFKAIIDEPPEKTIKQKLIECVRLFVDTHGTRNFTLLEQMTEGHFGYTNSILCSEVEKMFGN